MQTAVSAMTVLLGWVLSRLLPKAGIVSVDPTGLSRDPDAQNLRWAVP